MISREALGIDKRGIAEMLAGAGVLALAFARHMPPPYEDQNWYGAVFDTVQDRFNNNDRIGLRRPRVPVVTPPVMVPNAQEGNRK